MNLKRILELIEEDKFYKTKEWRWKRNTILERDNFECQRCKSSGLVSKGECVHHMIHLKDNPSLAFDDENLLTLCLQCHNVMHPEKGNFMYAKQNGNNCEIETENLQNTKNYKENLHGKVKRRKARFTNVERW